MLCLPKGIQVKFGNDDKNKILYAWNSVYCIEINKPVLFVFEKRLLDIVEYFEFVQT